MSHHTKLDEKLEGDDNFQAWKYRISLVLEENDLDSYISEKIPVREGDKDKGILEFVWWLYSRVPFALFLSSAYFCL